jgi:hypothetical protein
MLDTVRRALGLAVQIIEEMPEKHQQYSNMNDMRHLLTGGSTGRDDYIILQALTLALALRASTVPPSKSFADIEEMERACVGFNNRLSEFGDLFSAPFRCMPGSPSEGDASSLGARAPLSANRVLTRRTRSLESMSWRRAQPLLRSRSLTS